MGSGMMKFLIPVVGILGALAYFYDNRNKEQALAAKAERSKSKLTLG